MYKSFDYPNLYLAFFAVINIIYMKAVVLSVDDVIFPFFKHLIALEAVSLPLKT